MPRILLLCLVIISLSAYGSSSTGLTIVPRGGASGAAADDEPNGKRTIRTVAVGDSATGNVESSGDKDWFRVTLASVTKYRFDLESEAVNGATALGDPRLVFRNISADRLGVANGGGTGKNARLEYTVPATGAGDYLLVAMGQRGSTGSYRLSVTAIVNRAPQPAGSISGPPPLTERGALWSVDVSGKFTDPDNDTLSYTAESSDNAIATANAVGSTVTITPLAAGTATITVTATDPGGRTATQEFSMTVNSSNRAPVPKGSIGDLMLTLGDASKELDVSEKFVDADGDTLSYTAESPDITIATANVSDSTVTITPVSKGIVTITVKAKDPSGLEAEQTFSVTVSNNAPTAISSISPLTLTLGDEPTTVDVSGKFRDPDGHTLTYTAESSDSTITTASASGNPVTITPVAAGAATITVTAKDLGGLSATQEISVTVLPQPNRKPILVGSIDAQQLEVGKAAGTVNVSGKFSDPDGDTLSYEVESSNAAIVVASMLNSVVILTPVKGGTVTITVTAEDPGGLSAEQTFSATVANRAPITIGEIRDKELWVGDILKIRAVNKFTDPDGDPLTYEASISGASLATINISDNIVSFTVIAVGEATFRTTAKDPSGEIATHNFLVIVPNRAPTASGSIGNQRAWIGGALQVDVSGKFSDLDRHALTYTPVSSHPTIATVRPSGSTVIVTPVAIGTTTITVTAQDPLGETAIQKFSVTVPNRPPGPNSTIPHQNLTGTASLQVNMADYFRDPDLHALTYTPVSDNTAIATVRASGSTVIITPGVKGIAKVTITAQDPLSSTAIQSFSVTVRNRPPTRNSTIANQTLNGTAPLQINVGDHFIDPDRHTLTYTPISDNIAVATVRASGGTVIITPGVKGTARITITARDPFDRTAAQSFSVTVSNRPPTVAGKIDAQRLQSTSESYLVYIPPCGASCSTRGPYEEAARLQETTRLLFSVSVDVSAKFSDPDGDTLTYTATISGGSFTSTENVPVSGSAVSISKSYRFRGTVTVVARDPGGLTATQTFTVGPPNRAPIKVGSIGTQQIYDEFSAFTTSINVSGKFRDPDGDTLTYSARSSATNVATAVASGNTVVIRAVSTGSAFITVTATDPGGLKAKQVFIVSVSTWGPMCGDYYC